MPIQDSFDAHSPEMIRASEFFAPIPDFPETVVVTYSRHKLAGMLAGRDAEEIAAINTSAVSLPIYRIEFEGTPLAVTLSTIGGSMAAGMMEELIAMGGRRFLFFGSCGALEPEILSGAIVVPTAAWRDEGTSYHYLPAADTIEIPTANRLGEILGVLGVPYHRTMTWTTDAIYRETRQRVQDRRNAGCGVVEMECASTAAVAQVRGVDFYQFIYGADSLADEEWDPRTLGESDDDLSAQVADIALRVAVLL